MRRLKQIGVVAKERGSELAGRLAAGQRLVSVEGDLWRWDGFVVAAHAPTGAARRLAERARLVDIEAELERALLNTEAPTPALAPPSSAAARRLCPVLRRAPFSTRA